MGSEPGSRLCKEGSRVCAQFLQLRFLLGGRAARLHLGAEFLCAQPSNAGDSRGRPWCDAGEMEGCSLQFAKIA
eukprot:3280075-Pleurochrysis_carterae.AAC.4